IGLAMACVSVAVQAPPVLGATRHHGRHHRHRHGGRVTCGPGTISSGGACVPVGPSGPVGNGNIVINPNSITMNLNGSFATSFAASGFPPLTTLSSYHTSVQTACSTFSLSASPMSDAAGVEQGNVSGVGCVPGTYSVSFTEGVSPFQTFIGFFTLHF